MTTGWEALHHVPHPEAHPAMHLNFMLKGLKLIIGGQLTPNEQVRRL
jgi:hypothetical protein